jgi:methenyltetrahydromethanopterin cyclohydrolase
MDKSELLGEIQALALGLMPVDEIAQIIEMDLNLMMQDPDCVKAIDAGLLMSKAQVWQSVQKLAASGSGPAQELALKRIATLETKRRQYE